MSTVCWSTSGSGRETSLAVNGQSTGIAGRQPTVVASVFRACLTTLLGPFKVIAATVARNYRFFF